MKYHKYSGTVSNTAVFSVEALHDLLFELAGADRLAILLELKKKPLRISNLSKKLGFTVQETSRNVLRLADSKLVAKEAEGCFRLTSYGEEMLSLLTGLSFLSKHREYFVKHSLSTLPREFAYSLAALDGCELVDDVMVSFSNVENMIQKAQEYVWILSDQILVSTMTPLQEALKRGIEFRLILPQKVTPPKSAIQQISDPTSFQTVEEGGRFQSRFLTNVDALICLSEKELAALDFLSVEGKIDYRGFHGEDELSLKWAKNLFSHYWNSATSREPDFF